MATWDEYVTDLIHCQVRHYVDPIEPLVRAWYAAEGGTPETFLAAIRCSFPECEDFQEAMARAVKTIRGRIAAYCEYCRPGGRPMFELVARQTDDPWTGETQPRTLVFTDTFIAFCGARIAPIGAKNDPDGLNRNWVPNVLAFYRKEVLS